MPPTAPGCHHAQIRHHVDILGSTLSHFRNYRITHLWHYDFRRCLVELARSTQLTIETKFSYSSRFLLIVEVSFFAQSHFLKLKFEVPNKIAAERTYEMQRFWGVRWMRLLIVVINRQVQSIVCIWERHDTTYSHLLNHSVQNRGGPVSNHLTMT